MSSAEVSSGPLPPGFRRLQRNDTVQTNDQWKQNLLRETGSLAPLWTACVLAGQPPVLDFPRPREPLKPSEPSIMAERRQERRAALALQTNTPIDAVPEVSPTTIWQLYADEKAAYEDRQEFYKIKFKEVNETFPQENRKVFQMVEKAMSEASVEDVKRTEEGAKAYDARDAFTFLRLAMDTHDFVPAQISDRACQNAQSRFETYRQPSSASISEHLNEFRRRLDYYCKVRGDKVEDVYKDYQLKGLLLASLHPEAWGEWHRIRQLASTMPATFEGVETALREEESARVLSSLKDPYGDVVPAAAHATTTADSLPPTCCSECGTSFCPRRSSHHRCATCQKKIMADKKKRRDLTKDRSGSGKEGKVPARGHTNKTVHETSASGMGASDDDDDNLPPWASYSTTVITALASGANMEDCIIFDPASNSHVIRDETLALDINPNGPITRIRGSVPGTLEVRDHATIGDIGTGPLSPSFTRNLISESVALAAGYHVIHDTRIANEYRLIKDGRPPLIFKSNKEGTYSMPISEFKMHFPLSYGANCHSTDVDRTQVVFTKQQRARAALYRAHHASCLGHAHDDRVIAAIEKGTLTDVPYTPADIRNAMVIHGPCQHCTKTKGTKHRRNGHYPHQPSAPGEYLAGDLFTIMGVLFYLITCRMVNLRIVIKLRNKSASQIMSATGQALGIWKGFGASPKVISWDQEPAMVSSAHEIWSKHGVKMDFTPPEGHEKVAERNVRTIKEHVFASVLQLGHPIDDVMLEGIVRDTVTVLNFLPSAEVDKSSPRTIIDGERLNYRRWSRFAAGQVGEFEIPYPDRTVGARKELGYILCHQGDNAVVRLLPSGKRTVVRSPHFTPLEKSPAILKLITDSISAAQIDKFNELLGEIEEHYGPPMTDPGIVPIPIELPISPPTLPEADYPGDNDSSTEHMNFFGTPPEVDNPHELDAADVQFPETPVTSPPVDTPSISTQEPTPRASPLPPPRRSKRSAAWKPPGFYAEATNAESIREYLACHMSATECAAVYGKEAQETAGSDEVINIVGRGALLPRNFRELTLEELQRVLPSFLFYKAKDLLPSELAKEDPPNMTWTTVPSKREKRSAKKKKKRVKIKGRWVGGGHKQKRNEALRDRVAPTARSTTHAIVMAIAAKEKRPLRVGDIPSAYLQAEHIPADGKTTFVRADKETTRIIVKVYPDLANYVTPNGTMILEVARALYGLVESAWLWYQELTKNLLSLGYTVTEADRGLFVKKVYRGDEIIASNIVSVHVDDLISAASPNAEGAALSKEFWDYLETKWPGIKLQTGPQYKHLSWDIVQDIDTGVIRRSQTSYIKDVLKSLKVTKFQYHPMRTDLVTNRPESPPLNPTQHSQFRSVLQKVAYAREGRPDIDFVVSHLQRLQSAPTMTDWNDLMHLLQYLNKEPEHWITHGPNDLQLRAYVDASYNLTPEGTSHYGFLLTVGHSLVGLKGGRIKTVVRSSTEAEIVGVNEVTSEILWARDVLVELGFPQHEVIIAEDNNSCITMMQTEPRNFQTNSRHVRVKWAFFRQEHEKGILRLVYCPTETMRADLLTKPLRGKVFRDHDSAIRQGDPMTL